MSVHAVWPDAKVFVPLPAWTAGASGGRILRRGEGAKYLCFVLKKDQLELGKSSAGSPGG